MTTTAYRRPEAPAAPPTPPRRGTSLRPAPHAPTSSPPVSPTAASPAPLGVALASLVLLVASPACAPSPAAGPDSGIAATAGAAGEAAGDEGATSGDDATGPTPAHGATGTPSPARLGDPVPVPSPAGPDAGEANLHAGPDGRVRLSWLEATGTTGHGLRFSVLDPGAPEPGWSAPGTVTESDAFFVNWADFPSLVALEDGTLVAHWLQREGEGYAYGIRITRSGDGGATWSDPVTPHHDGTLTEHGFVSLVPEPGGGFTAVWLDGRDFADAEPAAGGHGGAGEMSLRASTFAPDGTQGDVHLLDSRICECCQTSAARVGGELLVVYRDRSPEEVRDISAVTRGPDGWGEPVRLAHDGWQIPGCPVNGPAVAARGGRAAVAWFSLREGRPEVKVTFTDDAGRTFSDPVVVHGTAPSGDAFVPLGRVDVAWLDDRTAVVTWLAGDGGEAEVRALPVTVGGTTGEATVITATRSARSSGFPRIASAGGRLMVAWTEPAAEDGTARVRTAVLPILGPAGGPAGEAPGR